MNSCPTCGQPIPSASLSEQRAALIEMLSRAIALLEEIDAKLTEESK